MASKKKAATTVVAVATAAALLLGGTFAWQSISQTALNEASDVINPGGRLHNDMWYVSPEENNNDVYVENFDKEDIFARVRLEEYFEIVLNHGTNGEKSVPVIGTKTETDGKTTYTYERFTDYDQLDGNGAVQAGVDVTGDGTAYWTWQMGGETMFMPTFNMNKDSLLPDLNGIYEDGNVGTISNRADAQYSDWTDWANELDPTKTANEIWDIDSNDVDELKALSFLELDAIIDNGNLDSAYEDAVQLVNETHEAKPTQSAQLVSMTEWMSWFDNGDGTYDYSAYDPDVYGNYWVYDDTADDLNNDGMPDGDGWVYWSAKLAGGEATGLLLNGTTLNQVMDDTWYYAVNAVGQFCTPDDIGDMPAATFGMRTASDTDTQLPDNGTGFYADGETVTPLAEEFLRIIGATDEDPGADEEDPSEPEQTYSMHTYVYEGEEFIGDASYLVPEKEYTVVVHAEQNEYDDTSVSFSVTMADGTNLTAGTDYVLSATTAEIGNVLDESGYYHTATVKLTILNDELVGETIVVEAVADQTGNVATNEVAVHYEQKDVIITLYNAGAPVAGTKHGGTLAPNATYDIVATIPNAVGEDVVIYSTLDSQPVPDNIEIVDLTVYAHAGKHTDSNKIDEVTGKLVVGAADTFDGNENEVAADGGIYQYDSLTLAIGADIVRIYETADAKNDGEDPTEIYYTYGEWDIYPAGQEVYDIVLGSPINVSQQKRTESFSVHNGNDIDITDAEGLTVSVSGNTDTEGTKIEYFPATEETIDTPAQPAYYQLTIGEDETATELTITASIEGKGSGSKTVSLVYLNTLKIGDTLSDIWNYIYIDSSSVEKTYNLALVDYRGNAVGNVTYELVGGNTSEGTYVDGTTLHIGAEEQGAPMHLNVITDDVTTEYYVYVTYMPDTDAPTVSVEYGTMTTQNITIGNLSGEDFPLTLKAYAQTDEEGAFSSEAYSTISVTLTDGVPASDRGIVTDLTYSDGALSFIYGSVQDGITCYKEYGNGMSTYYGLKMAVTDAAGNTSVSEELLWTMGGCFVAGTQVQTVNGLVNIEDIKLGDMVYSIDLTTGAKVVNPVTWVQGTRYTDATYTIYAGSEKIVTTYEHPFYVIGKEWVAAEDLVVGDVIKTVDGQVTITNIVYTQLETPVQVYNFMVDGTHNYLISKSGLLVHNVSK